MNRSDHNYSKPSSLSPINGKHEEKFSNGVAIVEQHSDSRSNISVQQILQDLQQKSGVAPHIKEETIQGDQNHIPDWLYDSDINNTYNEEQNNNTMLNLAAGYKKNGTKEEQLELGEIIKRDDQRRDETIAKTSYISTAGHNMSVKSILISLASLGLNHIISPAVSMSTSNNSVVNKGPLRNLTEAENEISNINHPTGTQRNHNLVKRSADNKTFDDDDNPLKKINIIGFESEEFTIKILKDYQLNIKDQEYIERELKILDNPSLAQIVFVEKMEMRNKKYNGEGEIYAKYKKTTEKIPTNIEYLFILVIEEIGKNFHEIMIPIREVYLSEDFDDFNYYEIYDKYGKNNKTYPIIYSNYAKEWCIVSYPDLGSYVAGKNKNSLHPTIRTTTIHNTIQRTLSTENFITDDRQDIFTLKNAAIADLLINHNKLKIDKIYGSYQESEMLTAVANFVESGLELVVRTLQKVSGEYGEALDETMSLVTMKAIFYNWFSQKLLGKSLREFYVEETIKFKKSHDNSHIVDVINHITKEIKDCLNKHGIVGNAEKIIFKNIFPVGLYETKKWDEIDFAYISAGILFLNESLAGSPMIKTDEARSIGQALYILLKENVVPVAWVKYFKLSGIIQYYNDNFNSEKKQEDGEKAEIDYCFYKLDNYDTENNPLYEFINLLKKYRTRTQYYKDYIKKNYEEEEHLVDFQTLKEATDKFNKQNTEIADAFLAIDSLRIMSAYDGISDSEKHFMSNAELNEISASFTIRPNKISSVLGYIGDDPMNASRSTPQDVDLLMAKKGSEERIYWLRNNKDKILGYELVRVDKNQAFYYEMVSPPISQIFDQDLIDKTHLIITKNRKQQPFPNPSESKDILQHFAIKHRRSFEKAIHDYGYEKTSLEKVGEFFLALIPFYTCATAAFEEALMACLMDVLSLFPFMGKASSVTLRIAQKTGLGANIAVRNMLAQSSLKAALHRGGASFIRNAALPASEVVFDSKNLASLGIQALRDLDPGFLLISNIGKTVLKKFVNLSGLMLDSLPNLKRVLNELEQVANRLPNAVIPDGYGFIVGPNAKFPIKKINKKYNEKDVYVRVNEDTGELFGRKYTCSSNRNKRGIDSFLTSCIPIARNNELPPSAGSVVRSEINNEAGNKLTSDVDLKNEYLNIDNNLKEELLRDGEFFYGNSGGKKVLLSPEDWLIEAQSGGIDNTHTRNWAKKLLSQYKFPLNSLHNALQFAQDYFKLGKAPEWSSWYHISNLMRKNVLDQFGNERILSYFHNRPIASGLEGVIYLDQQDNYLVKVYSEVDLSSVNDANEQFLKYYGKDYSEVFHNEENVFMRMRKIPGEPLSTVKVLPSYAIEKFNDMLKNMASKEVFHADLKPDNILWDKELEKFNPIDFGTDSNEYSSILIFDDLLDKLEYEATDCIDFIHTLVGNSEF